MNNFIEDAIDIVAGTMRSNLSKFIGEKDTAETRLLVMTAVKEVFGKAETLVEARCTKAFSSEDNRQLTEEEIAWNDFLTEHEANILSKAKDDWQNEIIFGKCNSCWNIQDKLIPGSLHKEGCSVWNKEASEQYGKPIQKERDRLKKNPPLCDNCKQHHQLINGDGIFLCGICGQHHHTCSPCDEHADAEDSQHSPVCQASYGLWSWDRIIDGPSETILNQICYRKPRRRPIPRLRSLGI